MNAKTYRIGEAAALLNLKTYVLRFWEMEFPQIAPLRTEKGQRLYSENDLAALRRIRYLLHERGLTIEGARRILREEAAKGSVPPDTEPDIGAVARDDGGLDGPDSPGGPPEDVRPGGPAPAPGPHGPAGAHEPAGAPCLLSLNQMREIAAELTAVRDLLR